MSAKFFRCLVGLVAACAAARLVSAEKPALEPAAVDIAAARTLLLSQVPKVGWLLRETLRPLGSIDLAELVPTSQPGAGGEAPPSSTLEANSEQRQPLHLGASPREQMFFGRTVATPRLPSPLKALAEKQALWVAEHLEGPRRPHNAGRTLEFEVWPTQNDVGRLTWVMSRYRRDKSAPWEWLDATLQRDQVADPDLLHDPIAILPDHLSPSSRRGYIAIFRDFLSADTRDLYEKPRFSECVWTNAAKTASLAAWRPTVERPAQRAYFERASEAERKEAFCVALPQPARLNQRPLTLHLRVTEQGPGPSKVQFLEPVEWVNPPVDHPLPQALRQMLKGIDLPAFSAAFDADFRRDVAMLSGAVPLDAAAAGFGQDADAVRLLRKNSADPSHQLDVLLDYLEARYRKLGLSTQRQRFVWRGIPQSNLIAILPGRAPPPGSAPRPPIVLADHIDTAFCEDVFARSEQRVSAPGADDNASATAALLRAAEALRTIPQAARQHDIWLLHLTGEEFPADDLGARHFVSESLRTRTDIGALLLLDMVGNNPRNRPEYQLNSGGYYEMGNISMRLAQVAAMLTPRVAQTLRPLVYPPSDLRSYLYNTDGLIFAENGFPVVHFSEVMNRYQISRSGYHDSLDTIKNLDVGYAAAIARVAIATAAALSQLGIPAL